jgi:hypothetical protein
MRDSLKAVQAPLDVRSGGGGTVTRVRGRTPVMAVATAGESLAVIVDR